MKHFLVDINYEVSFESIAEVLPQHRQFLQIGYDNGMLLMSGPKHPKTGGLVIARGKSLAEIQSYFSNDPYQLNKFATYNFVEFEPVKYQDFLKGWAGD